MRTRILEISCDNCGKTAHYFSGTSDSVIREDLWIITADKHEFCCKKCYIKYKLRKISKKI